MVVGDDMQWRQSRQKQGLRARARRAKEDDPLEGYRERNPLLIKGFATITPGTKREPSGDLTARHYEWVIVGLEALHIDDVAPSTAHVRRWFDGFDHVVDRGCALDDPVGAFVFR